MKHREPRLVPVMEEVNIHNVFEHPPVDYYKYGEYPRYLSPIRDHNKVTVVMVEVEED